MRYNPPCVCGRSSSGRARPCQGRGSEFEPRRPLQKETPSVRVVFSFWNVAGRFELAASTCAKRVKFRGEAGFPRMAMPFAGCREASSSLVTLFAFALSFRDSDRCHWRGNPHPPSLASPFGRGGRAQRGRRGQTRANKEGPPPGGPSFMQFLQRFSTSRTPRQYPYRRRCTGWPGPSWPRAASASRAAG